MKFSYWITENHRMVETTFISASFINEKFPSKQEYKYYGEKWHYPGMLAIINHERDYSSSYSLWSIGFVFINN